ncbi:MAG: ABC transporter substrate-binding protein [Reyranella sp.]|nr:ABC transporter substrate-binding protein [Reyranella sp.]
MLTALAAAPLASTAYAQSGAALQRVGYLTGGGLAARADYLNAFRAGMAALGHVEGKTFLLESRGADTRFERLPALVQELLAFRPDVLLVSTTPAVLATKAATSQVPIVMVGQGDPVGMGLVATLARPGGNITGLTNISLELAGKRLELLKEFIPTASRIAVLLNPNDPNWSLQLRHAEAAAHQIGIALGPVLHLRRHHDLEPAFAAAAQAGANAALRMVDSTVSLLRTESVQAAARWRIPVMWVFPDDVRAGGLIAYGPEQADQYRQAASFVNRILRGARPAELPIEQPTRIVLAVNVGTARGLGLSIPSSVLARADEVIE